MPVFSFEQLVSISTRIFEAAGAPADEAETVARLLATANLVGHDSHGVIRIPQYLGLIEAGNLTPGAPIEITRETPSTAVVNGNWGFGQVIASRAVRLAIEKARNSGVSCVGVRCCNHIGRLGDYALMAADQDMIAMITANNHGAGRNVAPWGGRERRLSTSPICVAVPRGGEPPILMDITSSVVAEGKVRVMRNRGEQIPEGWIIDAAGHPSTNPNDLYGPPPGAILPFGGMVGHKGFALGVMIEILSGGLSGAGCSRPDFNRNGNALSITVYNIAHFAPLEQFYQQVNDFVDYVKSSAPAPGFREVIVPGEPETRIAAKRRAEGVFIEDETWRQILAGAERLGITPEGVASGKSVE
jgi:uncharacterized oxidoreductase